MKRRTVLALPMLLLVASAVSLPGAAQQRIRLPGKETPPSGKGTPAPPRPEPARPPSPEAGVATEELQIEVRGASIGDVVREISTATGVPLEAVGSPAATRVSLHAEKTSLRDLQLALAAHQRTRWVVVGEGPARRGRLEDNLALRSAADSLRRERRRLFLSRLAPRASDSEPHPLLVLLDTTAAARLVEQGAVAIRLRDLPPEAQALAGRFFWGGMAPASQVDARRPRPDPDYLVRTDGRLEYHLLYGDHGTGPVLVARVGSGEHWAQALFPSSEVSLPDYAGLYPEAARRTPDTELATPLAVKIDPRRQTADQALLAVARTARINLLCDAVQRPETFSARDSELVAAGPLERVLDSVCRRFGLFWWKSGNWVVVRSRQWFEAEEVAPPERLIKALTSALTGRNELAADQVIQIAALTPEQLLTLDLQGAAEGGSIAPVDRFDLEELQFLHDVLSLYARLTPGQREAARTGGLPYRLLDADQKQMFEALIRSRNARLDMSRSGEWRLTAAERFDRRRGAVGGALQGTLAFGVEMDGARRTTDLMLRVPARDVPAGPKPAPAAPGAPAGKKE